MHLNKLITHLKELDKLQLKRFGEFVHSPYFKVPAASIALFDYIELLHPAFEEKKLQPAVISKKIEDRPSENKQAKAGTELLKGLERFLATERWYNDERNVLLDMLWEQNELQWQGLYEDNLEKLEKSLQADKAKGLEYFYQRHILMSIESNGYRAKMKRNAENILQPVVKTLDEFYAVKKLRYHCELLSRHQILGTPYEKENVEELLVVLEPFNNVGYPYVHLFVNIYQMLGSSSYAETLSYYQDIKNYVVMADKDGLVDWLAQGLEYAGSIFQNWFNKGVSEAANESLLLLELRLKHNQILEQGKITPILFRNIVSLAVLTGKEAKWINHFIETFSANLPPDSVETNLAFARGQYFHYMKNYGKALPLYQQAQVKNEPIFNAIVRRWQFMCMYEQDSNDKGRLSDFVIAFEKYLKRNAEDLHHFMEVFLLVTTYSKKLLNASSKQLRLQALEELEKEKYFAGKYWLIEQLQKR